MTHGIQDAPDIDVEDAAIFGFGCLIEWACPFDAGVVKRDVEAAVFADGKIDHGFHVGIFGDVRTNECRIAAEFSNFIDDLRTFFFTPPSEDDLGAGASKCDRRSFADAGSSSGHECNFPA